MKCWFCNEELIWNCDYSFEDYGLDGEGIVAALSCRGCGATFEGYLDLEENDILS